MKIPLKTALGIGIRAFITSHVVLEAHPIIILKAYILAMALVSSTNTSTSPSILNRSQAHRDKLKALALLNSIN